MRVSKGQKMTFVRRELNLNNIESLFQNYCFWSKKNRNHKNGYQILSKDLMKLPCCFLVSAVKKSYIEKGMPPGKTAVIALQVIISSRKSDFGLIPKLAIRSPKPTIFCCLCWHKWLFVPLTYVPPFNFQLTSKSWNYLNGSL